ncbi:MAG TPA: hypothetical protein VGD36_04340 [Xanthobacteraceae bacterium]
MSLQTTTPAPLMTVDQFLAWAEGQEGRYELYNGVACAMSPERVAHGEMKFRVQTALAIRSSSFPAISLPSVAHYLIVDPEQLPVLHHARAGADTVLTRIVHEGTIRFDPPGVEIAVADLFPPMPPA